MEPEGRIGVGRGGVSLRSFCSRKALCPESDASVKSTDVVPIKVRLPRF